MYNKTLVHFAILQLSIYNSVLWTSLLNDLLSSCDWRVNKDECHPFQEIWYNKTILWSVKTIQNDMKLKISLYCDEIYYLFEHSSVELN